MIPPVEMKPPRAEHRATRTARDLAAIQHDDQSQKHKVILEMRRFQYKTVNDMWVWVTRHIKI